MKMHTGGIIVLAFNVFFINSNIPYVWKHYYKRVLNMPRSLA